MAYRYTIVCMCICMLCVPAVQAANDTFANDVIEVSVSPYLYVYNESSVNIIARNPITGNPYTNGTTDITVYIQKPDGSFLVNGSHPKKFIDGIYVKDFALQQSIGTYLVWAIMNVSGTEYWGATMFEARYSPYTNITGAKYELENIVTLVNWLSRNNTREIISHIANLNEGITTSKKETEQAGIFDRLQHTMITSFISWIFMISVMLLIFIIGTWLYGRRKASKLALQVSNVPQVIVTAIARS